MASKKQKNTIPPEARPHPEKPQKILVPIDFSDNSKVALPYAVQYATQFGARIFLLYVVEPAPFLTDLRDVPTALSDKQVALMARTDLEAIAALEIDAAVPVEQFVKLGKAYQEIVALAEEAKVDLIIMATHGYTGLKHTLLGSTTERVVHHAPCPVLVVR
jgi:nucleotide-binding universal stress UspA family protein